MLSDRVRECLRHGDECMRQAAAQTDPKLRRDYLIIGACWLKLIRELERLDRQFTAPAELKEGRKADVAQCTITEDRCAVHK
jgi:hypothetical protein